MYSYIVKKPASSRAAAAEVYLHVSYVVLHGKCLVSYLATWVWNPLRAVPMQGVTIQVSDQKIITACITDLKKNLDT